MAIKVKDLMDSRQELALVTAKFDDLVTDALSDMLENNFSQLPVIDDDSRLFGIISTNSILKAIQVFNVPFNELRVSHAAEKCKELCKPDDDLSDLFEKVKRLTALVIVDNQDEKKPIGIISTDDLLDFYYRRAENILLIHNIESSLKEHIRFAIDESKLADKINSITNGQNLEKFKKSIYHYKSLTKKYNGNDDTLIGEVFAKTWMQAQSKSFDDLSLNNYIELLVCTDNATYCDVTFNNLQLEAIKNLLIEIKQIRNDFFHFRREIGIEDYQKLRYCSDWLARHPANLSDNVDNDYSDADLSSINENSDLDQNDKEKTQVHQSNLFLASEGSNSTLEASLTHNKYSLLMEELKSKREEKITYTFKDIENIIKQALPQGAKQDRSWWSNHESQPWVMVEWYVYNINMIKETVTFVQKPYAKEYTEFFQSLLSELLSELNEQEPSPPFKVWIPYQDGRHYTTVMLFPTTDEAIANLTYSFNNTHQSFRIELFIDKNNYEGNKRIYDEFEKKSGSIKQQLKDKTDGEMMWERIDHSKPSRISLCYPHQIVIIDDEEKLNQLKTWAKDAIIHFYKILLDNYQKFA